MKTKRVKRINWRDGDVRLAISLGKWGISYRKIMEATGLTHSQVGYRLRKREVRLSDYRNGVSRQAQSILNKYL